MSAWYVLASLGRYPVCPGAPRSKAAAFPSGLCAERTALFAAGAQYPDQPVTALAIAARKGRRFLSKPISPCGACRQVISGVEERFGSPIRILLYGTDGILVSEGISPLLPLRFEGEDMHP